MKQIKHPFVGSSRLAWSREGAIWKALDVQTAKYRHGKPYEVSHLFAILRPAYNEAGLFHELHGWVVSRTTFDQIEVFDDFETAKVYVQSLYELEKS